MIENLEIEGVEITSCDIFSDELPSGDVYILSRAFHDWSDDICKGLLKRIPKSASLVVIDLVAKPSQHGLLSLNMLLVTGGMSVRQKIGMNYRLSGWEIQKKWIGLPLGNVSWE